MDKYIVFIILSAIASGLYFIARRTLQISDKGIALIKSHEGFSSQAYQDVAGYWTIGYGHKILETDDIFPYGARKSISSEDAETLLLNDLYLSERCVNKYVNVDLTQEQYDALVSFVYNIGCGNFQKSTMLNLLNNNNFKEAANEFPRWIYAKGVRIAGLANRRASEQALFKGLA